MMGLTGYTVTERLYDGAQTLVVRAIADVDGAKVVLKTVKGARPTLRQLATWQHEHELLRQLDLPCVPRVRGLELVGNQPTLVLEDGGGITLRNALAAVPRDLAWTLAVAIAVADALEALHARGVVHKDINPDNLVVGPDGAVQLIDFGIATRLAKQEIRPVDLGVLEGTLAYLAPEQTGRMNRVVDHRSDLYALGATLYELLAGRPPFQAESRLELVHCHLARQPEPLPGVPPLLAAVVEKLLAKTPEDRYQSAASLAADLRAIAAGATTMAALGAHARPSRLAIPQKLYGRAPEVEALLAAFERAAGGARELVLIGGYSGVGKTSLVQELHRAIAARHGFYAAGKFEQFGRDVPYRAVTQALAELVRQLLTLDDEALAGWRVAIAAALGANGRVLTDLVPEAALLLGPQPDVPELPPSERQNRFRMVVAAFVRVFATPAHPAVLFFDDLQWADAPSLQLIEAMAVEAGGSALLVIGAYRDNQVDPALLAVVERIASGRLVLRALTPEDTERLAADALEAEPAHVRPLAAALHAKAAGNPYFTNQLLAAWHEQGWLARGPGGAWAWDLAAIDTSDVTSNVAGLMASRLHILPPESVRVLQLAAFLGNRFDLEALALVHGRGPVDTAADLWRALVAGLVVPVGEEFRLVDGAALGERLGRPLAAGQVRYKFAHDHVQAAAYASVPPEERPALHLAIGRHLRAAPDPADRLFELATHLLAGQALLTDPAERLELAGLLLAAGKKARATAAFPAALGFLEAGLTALPADAWTAHYELALGLHLEAAEAAYLASNAEATTRYAQAALAQGRSLPDQVRAYEVLIDARIAAFELRPAVAIGLDVLALLGYRFPRKPGRLHVQAAFAHARWVLRGRPAPEHPMTDPLQLAAMRIMNRIIAPCYIGWPAMLPLVVCRQVELTARFGVSPSSAFAYATYGMILSGTRADPEGGYAYGTMALALLDRHGEPGQRARVLHIVHAFTRPWKLPARETLEPLMQAYRIGLEAGDFDYAIFALLVQGYYGYLIGRPLPELAREFAAFPAALRRIGLDPDEHTFWIWHQAIGNLMGEAADPTRLPSAALLIPRFEEGGDVSALFMAHFATMQLQFLFGQLEAADASSREAEARVAGMTGVLAVGIHAFYDALIALGLARTAPDRRALLARAARQERRLATWARHAPANFAHKLRLVQAERARLRGDRLAAMAHYQAAMDLAAATGYVQERAIAAELAASFYQDQGLSAVAATCLADARTNYARWGATAKVAQLDERFPAFAARGGLADEPAGSTSWQGGDLDYDAILKALRSISGQIVVEELQQELLETAVQYAGAERAVLLVPQDGKLVVVAGGTAAPEAVVNLAANSRQPVILADAGADPVLARDPYVAANRPRSVMCLPLVHQGALAGVLYLENNLATGVFTPRRLEALQLLSAHMAIGLTNAGLYDDLARAGRELQAQGGHLRQLLDAVPVGIFVLNAAGRPEYANQTAKLLLGRDADPNAGVEQLAATYQAYVAGTDTPYPSERMPVVQALAGKRGTVDDMEIQQGERRVPVEVTATPITDDGGAVTAAIAIFLDVTERKRAQRLLEAYNEQLEAEIALRTGEADQAREDALAANASKSRFLASMSHEIRTPLTAMLASADLLMDGDPGSREQYAAVIRRNGDHLLALINDILDLSKIEAGRLAVEHIRCSPAGILAEVEGLMAARAAGKGVGFAIRLVTALPAEIESDPTRLRQILINLVGNAVKFTEIGDVAVLASYEAGRLVVEVRDTGIGIRPEHLPVLFTPFEQGDASMTRRFGGSGLGLAISHHLAGALGGELAVASRPGEGSAFTLSVPAAVPAGTPFLTELAAAPPPAPAAEPGQLVGRVLLAEDGPDNQVLLRTLIRRLGPEVVVAENGQVAMDHARAGAFDLVLMDMQMPVMDGYRATAQLRDHGYRGPIVALTAHAMAGERERCLAAGCDDFLSKPVDRLELRRLVARYLSAAPAEHP
ncbi:MAG: sensor protein [Cyanobacteria bacterium RYN_339]|nr:sensor protein [Cyanobacteria bacterium RYN_339]